MEIKIEKGVPFTQKRGSFRKESSWVLAVRTMEVGDSFVVDNTMSKVPRAIAGYLNQRLKPMRFASSQLEDGSFRVWRRK